VAAWGGRTVLGIRRMTFLLYEAGRMQRIWSTVQPDGYAAEILAAIQGG
jgi:peroxiredoxin